MNTSKDTNHTVFMLTVNFAWFSGKGRHTLHYDTLSKNLERNFSCAN